MKSAVTKLINLAPKSKFKNLYSVVGIDADVIHEQITDHGYCLCRDCGLETVDDILGYQNTVMEGVSRDKIENYHDPNQLEDYSAGTDARPDYGGKILGVDRSTPNTNLIWYHNELAYTKEIPLYVSFICLKAAHTRGNTPFSDSLRVLDDLDSSVRTKLEQFGIRYYWKMPDAYAPNDSTWKGKSWQTLLGVETRLEAERVCEERGYEYRWETNDVCAVSFDEAAFVEHPSTGEIMFANSILGFSGAYFDGDKQWESIPLNDRPLNSSFGDGTQFSDDEFQHLKDIMDDNAVEFQWKEGDWIILDNLRWAHGRQPFEGERKIAAMMSHPLRRQSDGQSLKYKF